LHSPKSLSGGMLVRSIEGFERISVQHHTPFADHDWTLTL
jgi:hypothetical protein